MFVFVTYGIYRWLTNYLHFRPFTKRTHITLGHVLFMGSNLFEGSLIGSQYLIENLGIFQVGVCGYPTTRQENRSEGISHRATLSFEAVV